MQSDKVKIKINKKKPLDYQMTIGSKQAEKTTWVQMLLTFYENNNLEAKQIAKNAETRAMENNHVKNWHIFPA